MDSPTQAALEKSSTHQVAYLYVRGYDEDDEPVNVGLTTNQTSVSVTVISGTTGAAELRNYEGEGTLLNWDTVQDTVGLRSQTMSFKLSQLKGTVNDMVRAYNIRNAVVELHIGYKDILTGLLVSTPFPEFVGIVDTAKLRDGQIGSSGDVQLRAVSDVADLSLVSSDVKSHASQRLRDGDMFRQFSGVSGMIINSWGELRSKAGR